MDHTRAANTIRLYISPSRALMESSWLPPLLKITVAYCAPGVEDVSEVRVPPGSTVRDAIGAAQIHARRPELTDTTDAGIWGRRCSLDQPLTQGDRVELYRPLTIDPMEGRRARAELRRRRGAKS
ncbi:MAG: RnfH family protein [Burkholderiaceae bacterium]|nr:RnfH family protein [Burkholderiaceae bacterium]